MKKILKKFLILCISIIFWLSNTAVATSSSGDAFVTKEEFDNTLAEFNRRMQIFEAGINTKIDTQVSSYLNRNGIWNKTTQPINASSTAICGLQTNGSAAIKAYYQYGNSGAKNLQWITAGDRGYYLTGGYNDNSLVTLITKTNKAGLMLFRYDRTNGPYDGTTFKADGIVYFADAAGHPGDQSCCNFATKMTVEEDAINGDHNILYVEVLSYQYNIPAKVFNAVQINKQTFFFVGKNSKISVRMNDNSGTNQVGGQYALGTQYTNMQADIY